MCRYAEQVTRDPAGLTTDDLASLRAAGFDDRGIHDATQVIAYFNYINRVADALDVAHEDFIRPWEQRSHPASGE